MINSIHISIWQKGLLSLILYCLVRKIFFWSLMASFKAFASLRLQSEAIRGQKNTFTLMKKSITVFGPFLERKILFITDLLLFIAVKNTGLKRCYGKWIVTQSCSEIQLVTRYIDIQKWQYSNHKMTVCSYKCVIHLCMYVHKFITHNIICQF